MLLKVEIIHVFNAIWLARNSVRFKDRGISTVSSITSILSVCSLAGNAFKIPPFINIQEFEVFKKFKVIIHPRGSPKIVEVIWKPLHGNGLRLITMVLL